MAHSLVEELQRYCTSEFPAKLPKEVPREVTHGGVPHHLQFTENLPKEVIGEAVGCCVLLTGWR